MAGKVTLYDAIDSHVKRLANNLYTSLPAIVEKYDPSTQSVTVKPTLNLTTKAGQELVWPPFNNIPLIFPSGGGGSLTFPIKKGDNVLLTFSKNSIDEWKETQGKSVKVKSKRSHAISDAIAIAGLGTLRKHNSPDPDNVELKFKGTSVKLLESGDVEITSGGTIKLQNDTVELIDTLSNLIDELSSITVNTVYGASPVNNKVQLLAIKDQLDTLKG